MDFVESLAISEPLCAKILGLNAISKDDPEREEKYKALGLTIPPARFSEAHWGGRLLIPSSFRIKSGILEGAIKCITNWKSTSRKLTRQGRHGIGMPCF